MTACMTMIDSPVGELRLYSDGQGLMGVRMDAQKGAAKYTEGVAHGRDDVLDQAAVQLAEYFAGQRTAFDLPLAARGTAFQKAVWAELVKVAFGHTATYAELAQAIGRPTAFRAVARANATNPLGIVVPCHRIIGSNGTLTGYAGGVERKAWLLAHEGALVLPNPV